jgi:flagellar biosynthesis protein FlhG
MPEILPIGGGKGGVGKSFISANLGALIAKRGKRVVLVDLDLGASNLHTFLGITNPKSGLNSFLNKKASRLEGVALPTHHSNLSFISSVNCSMEIANLYHAQKTKLLTAINKLPHDYILLDLGAGTNFNTLDFFLTSDNGIVVCTPDPTSIENAFRFIKAAYLRRLKQIIKVNSFNEMVKDSVLEPGRKSMASNDIIEIVLKYDPEKEPFLRKSISHFQFQFILNQFRKNSDATLGEKLKIVCNRHFYSQFDFLGNIRFDERVPDSILNKTLFSREHPDAAASAVLNLFAERLAQKRPIGHVTSSYHERI